MSRVSSAVFALVCATAVLAPLPARADGAEANAISAGLLAPANASLQRALQDIKETQADGGTVAQANPLGSPQRPIRRPGLPQGFSYNIDLSFAYPYGGINYNAKMPGGVRRRLRLRVLAHEPAPGRLLRDPAVPARLQQQDGPLLRPGLHRPGDDARAALPEHGQRRRDHQGQDPHGRRPEPLRAGPRRQRAADRDLADVPRPHRQDRRRRRQRAHRVQRLPDHRAPAHRARVPACR